MLYPLRGQRDFNALVGQAVGALVACMTGMALDPAPVHYVLLRCCVQQFPQILVLHRLLGRCLPAA